MDEHILARQRSAMERYDLDALVAYSKENVAYGAGYIVPSQSAGIRNRQFAVAVNRGGLRAGQHKVCWIGACVYNFIEIAHRATGWTEPPRYARFV